jgi:hypothetical protein
LKVQTKHIADNVSERLTGEPVYICGAITGKPGYIIRFLEAERILHRCGWPMELIMNPVKMIIKHGIQGGIWRDQMAYLIKRFPEGGTLCRIPGWEESNGAVIENALAKKYGLVIFDIVGDTVRLADDYFNAGIPAGGE